MLFKTSSINMLDTTTTNTSYNNVDYTVK